MSSTLRPTATDIDALIAGLIARVGARADADLLFEMIRTVLELGEDEIGRGELKIVNSALSDLRNSFNVFARYRDQPKVTIFGSARTSPDHPDYAQAFEFARRIVEHGYMVITGGGGGVMLAANHGATRAKSFGCLIQLPFEPNANEIVDADPKLVIFKYFFTRKLAFVKETDAVVLFPGGFGTLDECFEVLTLIQTGKRELLPVVFLDSPGGDYWHSQERHIQGHLLAGGRIGASDGALYLITDDVERAVTEISTFYSNYHSVRYVGDFTILRHRHPIGDSALAELNSAFSDIVVDGRIERSVALPAEDNEPQLEQLPRLKLRFDRRQFGRLRQLVDRLNAAH